MASLSGNPSTSDPTSGPGAAASLTLCGPLLDLRAEPELDPAFSEIDGRPWHVCVPLLVLTDSVAVSEIEDVRDTLCINEVVDRDSPDHPSSLQLEADPSDPPVSF